MLKNWKKHQNGLLSISLTIILLISIIGCSNDKVVKSEIYYLDFGLNTTHAVDSCHKLFHYDMHLHDTIIENQEVLNEIYYQIQRLKPIENNSNMNYRIACALFMENGDTNVICLSTFGGIKYNKQTMEDSKELFLLFNELLYSDSLSKSYWSRDY